MNGIISNPISPNELRSSTANFIVVLFVYGMLIGTLETTGQPPQIYNTGVAVEAYEFFWSMTG